MGGDRAGERADLSLLHKTFHVNERNDGTLGGELGLAEERLDELVDLGDSWAAVALLHGRHGVDHAWSGHG